MKKYNYEDILYNDIKNYIQDNNINIIPANIEPPFSTDENNNFPIKAAIMKIIIMPMKEPRQLR